LAAVIIQVFLILSSGLNNGVLVSISLILTLVFLIKPYDNEVLKMDNILKLTIFYKTCISIFFIILIMTAFIVLTIIGRAIFIDQLISTASREELLDLYISSFSNILMAFIIPMIIYMLFLERYVVNPINRLSNYISQEINTMDDVDELKDNLKSIKVNNEIKSLSQSLVNMEKELVDYGEDLIKLTKDQERYETELKLAHDIQYSMIPTNFAKFYNDKNITLWGSMEAAREVGGDFYDYFQIDDDNVGFVIGDVSGKGVTAALIMVKAMTLIQEYAKQYSDLSKVFYEVNNELCEGNSETLFVTCWLGKLNTKTGKLSYVNAGHNPPLVKNGDGFEYLNSSPDLVLAAMEDMPYETHEIQLNSNDSIFLYTDGVTEANDNYNGFYGDERLKNILDEHQNDDLNTIIDCVKKDIDEFCNSQEQFDDTTMIIVRRD
jgi:serine phosphatase RsbU (regulator of sigma subunit)